MSFTLSEPALPDAPQIAELPPDSTFSAAKTPPLIAANHSHKRADFQQNRSKLINVRFLTM
jgi:hypothetical protein